MKPGTHRSTLCDEALKQEEEPLLPHAERTAYKGADRTWNGARRSWRACQIPVVVLAAALLAFSFACISGLAEMLRLRAQLGYWPRAPDLKLSPDLARNLAQYAPYYPAAPYSPPPAGCAVDQVHILQRHGARFPTKDPGKAIKTAVEKLQNADVYSSSALDFIPSYQYSLGNDDLVPFGAAQSYDSGQETYARYRKLVSKHNIPFVRSSISKRVVASANNWVAGFAAASHGYVAPHLNVILDDKLNDTLNDKTCRVPSNSNPQPAAWAAAFTPPIAARLNTLAPGANITPGDVPPLISLCGFDTAATARASPWCSMFTRADFAAYEYYGDLGKYYGTGYGQALGRVQGVGYVNELLARLTGKPVQDATQTNSTLDADPATFPLDRAVYADFSHDNQMVAIYAALGLFPAAPADMNPVLPCAARSWVVSRLVPFSGRMVVERLACAGAGTHVRIFVNDVVQPLAFCGARKGVCALDAFVESQVYARENGQGDWEKCSA